ncbi:MAG TPA: alpha/beta hydrolase [Acidimicrobiales bacterium]|nr:alpha/beta hydrolase [Acidimicrobiales bacterium]
MKTRTKLALGAGAGAALLAAGRAANKAAADRIRATTDPDLDPLYALPEGVIHHDLLTPDGGTTHVLEIGSGRPIVLVHGVTLQAEVWAPLMHLLSDRFRVVAVDVRGHGRSAVGTEGVGRVPAARDLAAVLEQLDLRGVVLTGHSMGGMIIGELCARHPEVVTERVAALVLMSTVVSHLVPDRVVPAARLLRRRADDRAAAGRRMPRLVGANDRSLLATRVAFGSRPSGTAVEQARRMGEQVDLRYYVPLWADLLDYDGEAALETLDIPALVLVGSRDVLTPPSMARRIVAHLDHGELHVLPGAGHQLMQERPHEVARLIADLAGRLEPVAAQVA